MRRESSTTRTLRILTAFTETSLGGECGSGGAATGPDFLGLASALPQNQFSSFLRADLSRQASPGPMRPAAIVPRRLPRQTTFVYYPPRTGFANARSLPAVRGG